MDIMITVLKSVKLVMLNVTLVTPTQVVLLVLLEEPLPQNVHVKMVLTLMLTTSVNLVPITVLNVPDLPITVNLVLISESTPQLVDVHPDISMMETKTHNVSSVPKDVFLVPLVTPVLLVLPEETVLTIVPVQPEPPNIVLFLEPILVMVYVTAQLVYLVPSNVLPVKTVSPLNVPLVPETELTLLLVVAQKVLMMPTLPLVHLVLTNVLLVQVPQITVPLVLKEES
jgi:hypothetical protein